MKVGDSVILSKHIWEHPTGDSPGGMLASKGDIVVIRSINTASKYPYTVAHPDYAYEGGFVVDDTEIELP